jgi:hypothetical protein
MTSYRRRGYRQVCLYIEPSLYTALVLRGIEEHRDLSSIVNEALRQFFNAGRATAQELPRPGQPQAQSRGGVGDVPEWLSDNPWVGLIRGRAGGDRGG